MKEITQGGAFHTKLKF